MEKLQNIPEKRRTGLLNAALKEFTERGFDQASTNEIAKNTGISKSLMFHYVKNKQELFILVYDYFNQLIHEDYFRKLDLAQKDLFARLKQSYLLQIEILKKHPQALLIDNLNRKTQSKEINEFLLNKKNQTGFNCSIDLFAAVATHEFRKDLDLEKAQKIILWTNQGLINECLVELQKNSPNKTDLAMITNRIDDYLDELKKLFYAKET